MPALGDIATAGDIIVDGGNSFYKDDIHRAKALAGQGIRYLDVGVSGGVWGLERGYCMMIGGDQSAVDHLDPIFDALSPGLGTIPRTDARKEVADLRAAKGYITVGAAGPGHFVQVDRKSVGEGKSVSVRGEL